MHKLRWALILPVVQCTVATLLLRLAYNPEVYKQYDMAPSELICQGLNGPAILFQFMDPARWGEEEYTDWLPRQVFSLYTVDLFFVAGVAFVWYLVGRAVDHRRIVTVPGKRGLVIAAIVNGVLSAFGAMSFWATWEHAFPYSPRYRPYEVIRAILYLAWAVGLMFFAGRAFVKDCGKLTAGGRHA